MTVAEVQGIRAGLDPKSPNFSKQVADGLKNGTLQLPEPKAATKRDNGLAIHARTQVIASRGVKPTNGATIVVAYRHTPTGGR